MATSRKLFHVAMIIDHSVLHDLMMLADGHAVKGTLEVHPVKHGGETETGTLKELPGAREFALAYATQHPRFAVKDLCAAAEAAGLKKQSIATACSVLATRDHALKRVGPGVYEIRMEGAKKAAKVKRGVKATDTKPPKRQRREGAQNRADQVIEILRGLQNGSGEGVPLKLLKKAFSKTGGDTNVSRYLTDLVANKMVVRTSPAHYRMAG